MDQPGTDMELIGEEDIAHQTEMVMDGMEDLLKQVSSPELMKQVMNLGVMADLSELRRSLILLLTGDRFLCFMYYKEVGMIISKCQNVLRNAFFLDQPLQQQQQQQQQQQGQRRRQQLEHKIWCFMNHIRATRSPCITRPHFKSMVNGFQHDVEKYDFDVIFYGTSRPELNFKDASEKWARCDQLPGVNWQLYLEDATVDIVRQLLTGSYATQVITICSPGPGDYNAPLMTELTQRIFIQDWRVESYFLQKKQIHVSEHLDWTMCPVFRYAVSRFLLVLEDDDVPDVDEECWNSLLQKCKKYLTLGSRILVTTQNKTLAEKIAETMVRPYYLPALKDENLLLEDQKNYGLWFSDRRPDWVGKRLLHLYCSLMLPHDHTLHTLCEEDLFDLFSAVGFLIIPSQLDLIEEESIRNQYLEGLKDVLADFPEFLRDSMPHEETHYRIINWEDVNQKDWLGTFRHMSINNFPHYVDGGYIFEMLGSSKAEELLTVLIFTDANSSKNFKISKKVPRDLSSTCKNLRVLSLQDSGIKYLPECLCTLFSLRYLNLSRTRIKTMPELIGNLQNLQTLKLSHCRSLRVLPESISNLVSLQKLDMECCYRLSKLPEGLNNMISLKRLMIQKCYSLSHMPSEMGDMYNLFLLSNYILGEGIECGRISELEKFFYLLGTLHIENLNIVKKPEDAQKATLINKGRLRSLVLQWNREDMEADSTERSNVQNSVLQELRPNSNLLSLKIISYTGTCFPPWMMNDIETRLSSLVEIRLINLKTCVNLPLLGKLPNLKKVEISGMDAIKSLDEDFCRENGAYPALEKLTISQMPNLERWSSVVMTDGAKVVLCPHLTHLNIIQCPKLKMLPSHLPSVKELALWMNNEKLYSTAESLKCLSGSLTKLSIYFVQDYYSFSMFQGLKESRALEIEIFECKPMHNLLSNMKCLSELQKLTLMSCENLESFPEWLAKSTFIHSLCVLDCPSSGLSIKP